MKTRTRKPPIVEPRIRWMVRKDLSAVLEIEERSFDYPWDESVFIDHLRRRNCIGMVVVNRDQVTGHEQVVGYMLYELQPKTLEIINFAVHPDERHQDHGRRMIEKLKNKLCPTKRIRLSIAVRETNLDAQLFFKAMGFRAVSILRDYYEDYNDEAAYVFNYRYRPA
jgi:ribosomal-protein-alanine N-acetyltransferase